MAKRGRTPSYTPDYCTIAYKFCLLGATNEDLAELFEVSRNTIGNWLARYPRTNMSPLNRAPTAGGAFNTCNTR